MLTIQIQKSCNKPWKNKKHTRKRPGTVPTRSDAGARSGQNFGKAGQARKVSKLSSPAWNRNIIWMRNVMPVPMSGENSGLTDGGGSKSGTGSGQNKSAKHLLPAPWMRKSLPKHTGTSCNESYQKKAPERHVAGDSNPGLSPVRGTRTDRGHHFREASL